MPVISVYRHGMACGVPPLKNDHQRAPRGDVSGWSESATRRNTRFLYSIQEHELTGYGIAVTLTLRECPPSAEVWGKLRRAWLKRMERLGLVRLHWVTEWQRRGVPHLHGAMWFSDDVVATHGPSRLALIAQQAWVDIAEPYGAALRGQHARPIDGPVGWFQYLSKHAARGLRHYQRSSENLPPEWKTKTGRMWGHTGDWPVREAIRIELQGSQGDGGYFAWRRLVRSWRLADARASGEALRVRQAKRLLRCNEEPRSRVRGLTEWIPEHVQEAMLANLANRGYSVTC